jgi:hypothetical protein
MTTISIGAMYRMQNKTDNTLWAFYVNCGMSDADEMMFIIHQFHRDSMDVQVWLVDNYHKWLDKVIEQNYIVNTWELSDAAASIRD